MIFEEIEVNNKKYYFSVETLQLFDSYSNDVLPLKRSYRYKKDIRKITLNIANDCNAHCKYCFQEGGTYNKQRKIMDKACFKKAILTIPKEIENIGIFSFFGGEPLLNYDLIKTAVPIIKSKYNVKEFEVTTNGILLNKEIIRFFADNNFKLVISFDGPKKIHNFLRIGCDHNEIYGMLKYIKEINYTNVVLNCTYTKYHQKLTTYTDLVNYFQNLGISYHISDAFGDEQYSIELNEEYEKFRIDETIKNLLNISTCKDLSGYVTHILTALYYRIDSKYFCEEIGHKDSMFFDVNGNQKICSGLLNDIDNKIVNFHNTKNKADNNDCWAIKLCQKCVAQNVIKNENVCVENCKRKLLYKYSLKRIIEVLEDDQNNFQNLFVNYLTMDWN